LRIDKGVGSEVVGMEPLGDRHAEEEGGIGMDVTTEWVAEAVGTKDVGSIAIGLDIKTLVGEELEVPRVFGDTG